MLIRMALSQFRSNHTKDGKHYNRGKKENTSNQVPLILIHDGLIDDGSINEPT
jgi:hypothetical protein